MNIANPLSKLDKKVNLTKKSEITTKNASNPIGIPGRSIRHRNKVLILLKLPIIVFLGLFGWILICVGSTQKSNGPEVPQEKEVLFAVIPPTEIDVIQKDDDM